MEDEKCTNDNEREEAPRIYVASLADYNAGILHGRWVNANQEPDAIRREIAEMLAASREPVAEEWAVHDYENFGPLRVEEYADLDELADAAALIGERGELAAALLQHLGGVGEFDAARRHLEDGYRGAFDTLAAYVEDFVEECYADAIKQLPDFLRYHIDYDGIANDLELSGDVFTVEVGRVVHVFDGHG